MRLVEEKHFFVQLTQIIGQAGKKNWASRYWYLTQVDRLLAHLGNTRNDFFVPDLFYIECTNTFWKYIRAGRYDAADLPADLATLKALRLRAVSTADLMEDAANIAISYGISAYDASYVALSQQVNATLLTLDERLVSCRASKLYFFKLGSLAMRLSALKFKCVLA